MKKVELIKEFEPRSYQQSIFANSLNKNSLVVLPTGLGKTVIALMLSTYYFNQGGKKVLFLAPTKPLVEQQKISFENFIKNSEEFNFQVLTGLVSPKKREIMYQEQDFIFSTPQLIENDIVNKTINPQDFGLVIIDEAHRGTGNYAYCFIAEQFAKSNSKILALTASPGTTVDDIKQVMENLSIEHIEVKKYEDDDVKPYVNKTNIEYVQVELDSKFSKIKKLLKNVIDERLRELRGMGFLHGKSITQISKKDLLLLQIDLRKDIGSGDADENTWRAISLCAGLMKLQYGQELYESQEIGAAHTYFHNFFRAGGDSSKAVEELTQDIEFRQAYEELSKLKKAGVKHPKLLKLKEVINEQLIKNEELKIIIFAQYRDSAQIIVEELSEIKGINPALFVGQAKKGEFKLSQKDQKKVIQDFRENKYNVLVSTSVGEEGLDIPKVDLVTFYEPVPSAIRTIQRIGRTGRFNQGNAIIMQTKDTRDMFIRHVANAKEKRMYKALDTIKNTFNSEERKLNAGLSKFLKEKNDGKEMNKNNILKTIIFDLNNTIVTYKNRDNIYIIDQKFIDLIGIDSREYRRLERESGFEDYCLGKINQKELLLNILKKLNKSESLLEDLTKLENERHTLIEGMDLVLKKLSKNYELILFAGDGMESLEYKLKINGIHKYFKKVFCSCFEKVSKSKKEYYLNISKNNSINFNECLFIDDTKSYLELVKKEFKLNSILFEGKDKLILELEKMNLLTSIKSSSPKLQESLDNKIPIYVDQRENTDLIKEIFNLEELNAQAKQLEVGDIVVSQDIGIERKAKIDFVNSIIDKRLFPQLINLARSFKRPILILEGEENIFSLRNINPNVIRATISAIAVDLRIPIIVTNNMKETAQMVLTIAKRNNKDKKEISLATNKKSFSENEEMEKFISSIPNINVVNAKLLLNHFKSIKDLINTNEEELVKIKGIGKGRAKNLVDFFNREYQL